MYLVLDHLITVNNYFLGLIIEYLCNSLLSDKHWPKKNCPIHNVDYHYEVDVFH